MYFKKTKKKKLQNKEKFGYVKKDAMYLELNYFYNLEANDAYFDIQ